MISINEIRQKYPDYDDLSDQELADSLYSKHYSDMPKEEYYSKIGFNKLASKNNEYLNGSPEALSFEKLKKRFPDMPEFLMKGLISASSTSPQPHLQQAANIIEPAGNIAKVVATGLIGGPALKGLKMGAKLAPEALSKLGDIAPLIKKIASKPYKEQMTILENKNLLQGYKPNASDVLEASRILKSPGMTVPHEAVDLATAEALEGNFKPWFDLQSSVRSQGRLLSKKGGVNNTLGQNMYKLAEKMHQEMGEQQTQRGAPEAAAKMQQGKARTSKYNKILPYRRIATGASAATMIPKWLRDLFNTVS